MATSVMGRGGNFRGRKQAEGGFSLIEVLISMVILTVGLVSLLGVFGLAMAATQTSQQDMIAKQLANEALESVVTARNTSQISWDDIQNVGSTNCPITFATTCGIFVGNPTTPTFEPIANAGLDGIFGTADDTGEETLEVPGPDGVYGDPDDVKIPLTGYTRAIQLNQATDANGNPIASLRFINITVQYSTTRARLPKTYVLSSYISEYR